ncbi:MAG: TIGR03808 family TAT-translocated repetitive protein [Devosiaceae bacterium]|nr:TIGR03808 family TAT-translocated repetitive protein [Devosiaceae bacterium]
MRRRSFLKILSAGGATLPAAALSQPTKRTLEATSLGIIPNSAQNQTSVLQSAVDLAAKSGSVLNIPAGRYIVDQINLEENCSILGVGRATEIISANADKIFSASNKANISLEGLSLIGGRMRGGLAGDLLTFESCENINISNCRIEKHNGNGIWLRSCSGQVTDCDFEDFGQSAIHAQNSTNLQISFNKIYDCSNGGIRVWRDENGNDGTIVTNNQISGIGSESGNGQNGNGINIFLADGVIVADNVIANCAFSAIRANSTNNTIITGNQCNDSSEVAIFSEFAFSGSIIAQNIVDGAAMGISMANLDVGGRLAICSNNIVRNILPFSPTNPDTSPVGIFAEADTAIVSNVIENVPGAGIVAGWGPFLRNVMVSNNIIRQIKIGIAASVAPGAGVAKINDNMIIEASDAAIVGMAWREIVSADLVKDAPRFPNISLSDNLVS